GGGGVTWREFKLVDLFNYTRGTRLTKENRIKGNIPLVTAGESNQGVKGFISNESQQVFSHAITIDMFCNSFVHIREFCCDDNILVLTPKQEMSQYHLMFISVLIAKSKSKYNYGKQYRINSLEKHSIPLPTHQDGTLAYDLMENFIKALEKQQIERVKALWDQRLKAYEDTIYDKNLKDFCMGLENKNPAMNGGGGG
ncbi:restriction endonuclease subunit S, partial [Helicobacter heilmannii]|uniref:restriction endonuclease subunit S n=2 Tax=Helicobacter heilmannii TaxID=35817 RepID=UPI0018D3C8DF